MFKVIVNFRVFICSWGFDPLERCSHNFEPLRKNPATVFRSETLHKLRFTAYIPKYAVKYWTPKTVGLAAMLLCCLPCRLCKPLFPDTRKHPNPRSDFPGLFWISLSLQRSSDISVVRYRMSALGNKILQFLTWLVPSQDVA